MALYNIFHSKKETNIHHMFALGSCERPSSTRPSTCGVCYLYLWPYGLQEAKTNKTFSKCAQERAAGSVFNVEHAFQMPFLLFFLKFNSL